MRTRTRVVLSAAVSVTVIASCAGGDDSAGDGGTPDDAGGAGPDAAPVVECATSIPTPSSGVCAIGAGGGGALVLRGDVLAPDQVLVGGSVVVDRSTGLIECVGCDCPTDGALEIDCPGAVISPALINPHDHMTFSENAPANHGTTRYDHRHDWRGSIPTPTNAHGTGSTSAGTRWVEIRQVMAGTVTMAGSGSATGMVRNLDRNDLLAPSIAQVEYETFPLGDGNETFHADCDWSYRSSELQVAGYAAYLPHVAEGGNDYAAEEFRCQSTSFGGGHDYVEPNVAFMHAIGLTAEDYDRMARGGTGLIWSPRSNVDLYGMTAEVTTFDRLGGTISLGTDWSYSGSINMLRELACADSLNRDYYDGYFSDKQLWEMATIHAADVTGSDGQVGALATGSLGDIAVFAGTGSDWYRAIIGAGSSDVVLVLRGGTPLYGVPDVVAGAGETCETLDVCGHPRALCAAREFGVDYASLAGATAGSYPAFFCGIPEGEPSCVPSRPGEYDGPTATDGDGDGVSDALDNCPRVFNPIRLIDGGGQPDADADGLGDPCDRTPLAADIDGDGVTNDADNCPFDDNAGQTDADTDGKGDACDFCPDVSNPVSVCPAPPPTTATIEQIETGAIASGTLVSIEAVVVTARSSAHVAVQDPSAASPESSGITVHVGSTPGAVQVGDVVNVQGTVDEYFQDTEIDGAMVSATGASLSIVATPLTVAQATTEPYEGVLVRLTDGAMTSAAFDCSVTPPCSDANLWEIDGASGLLVYDRFYEGSDFAAHIGDLPLTGVMMYRFERRRIMSRTAADFGP